MEPETTDPRQAPGIPLHKSRDIPLDTLVIDVYDSVSETQQHSMVSHLVGKVYASAPPQERGRLLAQLIKPLGILSLATIANGTFARLRLQGGSDGLQGQLENMGKFETRDVIALVEFVQQVSERAVNALAQTLSGSPVLAASAAAAVLVTLLARRAKAQAPISDDGDL